MHIFLRNCSFRLLSPSYTCSAGFQNNYFLTVRCCVFIHYSVIYGRSSCFKTGKWMGENNYTNYTVYSMRSSSLSCGVCSAHNFYRSQIFLIPKNPLPCILHLKDACHFPNVPPFISVFIFKGFFRFSGVIWRNNSTLLSYFRSHMI